MENFDIRFSEMEDLPHLQEWFRDPLACHDFPFDFEEKENALNNWIGFSKYKASLTGLIADKPVAIGTLFLMPYKKVAHHCSFYLMVAPAHRRKGIGSSMVRNLLHLAKTRFLLESVHAEVFEPSGLQPLLEKQGFALFARQDDYMKMGDRFRARVLLEHFFA